MATCMRIPWCMLQRIPVRSNYRLYKQIFRGGTQTKLKRDVNLSRCIHSSCAAHVDLRRQTYFKSQRKNVSSLENHFNNLRECFYQNKMVVTTETLSELMFLLKEEQFEVSPYVADRLLEFLGNLRFCMLPTDQVNLIKQAWKLLKGKGLKPEANHYYNLMKALVAYDDTFCPDEILLEMQADGVPLYTPTYMLIIDAYCKLGDINGAGLVLEMMQKKGIQVDEMLPELLIKGYFRANLAEKGMAIFDEYREKSDGDMSMKMYTLLMKLYAEKGDIESMKKIKQEAEDDGITFDSITFVDLIETLWRFDQLQHLDEVMDVTQNWLTTRRLDFAVLYAKLEMSGNDDAALKLLDRLDGTLVRIQDFVVELLLKVPIKQKWPIEDLLKLVQRFFKMDLPVDPAITVFAAYKYGEIDYAVEILDHMKQKGIPIKAHYFYPAILRYSDKNDMKGVLKSVQKMASFVCPADIGITKVIAGLALDKQNKHRTLKSLLQEHEIDIDLPEDNHHIAKGKTSGYKEFLSLLNDEKYDEALEVYEGSAINSYFSPKSVSMLCRHYIGGRHSDWSKLQRTLKHAFKSKQLFSLSLQENEFFEDAPQSIKTILTRKIQSVLHTYSNEELQMSLNNAGGISMKRIIQGILFMRKQSVQESEEILSNDELKDFNFSCVNHKIILYLKENQTDKATVCLQDIISASDIYCDNDEVKSMTQLLSAGVNGDINEVQKVIDKCELKDVVRRNPTFLGHWIQSLCHVGTPEEIYRLIKLIILKYKHITTLLCDHYLQGYISRDIPVLVLDAYNRTILNFNREGGSHFVMEYLTRKEEYDSLVNAHNVCMSVFGKSITASSFFYATALNRVPDEVIQKIDWQPGLVNVKSVSCIFSSLIADLSTTEAFDRMEKLIDQYDEEKIADKIHLSKMLCFFSTKASDFPRALRLFHKLKHFDGNENLRYALSRHLRNRNNDIGLNVPEAFFREMHQLNAEQKESEEII